jgi:hypothetical protein
MLRGDCLREDDLMKFAETVAVNRGLPVTVFSSVSDAEKWLQSKDHGKQPTMRSRDANEPSGGTDFL